MGRIVQRLEHPSPQHYIGLGKLNQLVALKEKIGFDTVICDDELSPRQQRNLEEALKVKILDRTALILDIFAKRAQTHEGRLQVELAQHQYLLPRLAGQWTHLERLGGGIGTRGPGESQIETDRRLIRKRIHNLEEALERVRSHRALYRDRRRKSGIPIVALVGYTNVGKSTLLNTLGSADVFVEDKPFATLDPTTRRVTLPSRKAFLLTDTVGFIHKLPPAVVAAFRATLEELAEADLLLHVVDVTHKNAPEQCQTVEDILRDLGLAGKPTILVLNKIDLLEPGVSPSGASLAGASSSISGQPVVMLSAAKGWGLDKLLAIIETELTKSSS